MPVTVTVLTPKEKIGNGLARVKLRLALSGTCPASPGEPLDLRPYIHGNAIPERVTIQGKGDHPYAYVPGNDASDGTVRTMVVSAAGTNGPLTAHTNTTYVSTASGDVIDAEVIFRIGRFA